MKTIEQIQKDAELTIIKQRCAHFIKLGETRQISASEWSEIKQLAKRQEELKPLKP